MARSRKANEPTEDIEEVEEVVEAGMSVSELAAKIKELQVRKRQAEDEERANKPPPRRGRGVMATAKRILWFEPNIDIADLHKRVVSECGPCSLTVIQTTRSDFRNTIEVLRELGKLKEDPFSSPGEEPVDNEQEGNNSDDEGSNADEVVENNEHEEPPKQD